MPSPGDLPDAGVKPGSAGFQADSLSSEPPGKPIGFTQSSFLLRNLYAGQEATVRTGHGTTDWFQIGKGVCKAASCHPAYLTYMHSTS